MVTESKNKKIDAVLFLSGLFATVAIAFIPYIKQGLPGHFVDMMYQMERIEGLKKAILSLNLPPRIYPDFFNGFGYGSPLFYSDIFFTLPAILRIVGFSMTQTWKLFVLFLVATNYVVTFVSFKTMCKSTFSVLTGTVSLVLCQFYLMDLSYRSGLGEYMAIIFLPVLFAAIYDYLVLDGKKIRLFGIAFGGMLLSHTIMVFLAFLFTVFVFICALISRKYRKKVFTTEKIKRLVITALFTIGVTAYYFLPMLEQMLTGEFLYQTPWVHLSEYLAPLSSIFYLKGSMFFTAYVGLGVAFWLIIAYGIYSMFVNNKNGEALFLIILGLVIAVITTDIFPWKIFDNSILNNIQFTFRILPYAVCPIALGGAMFLDSDKSVKRTTAIGSVILITALIFGIYQNMGHETEEATYAISNDFLATEGTMYVGKGEWLPVGVDLSEFELGIATGEISKEVESSDGLTELNILGTNSYSFIANESEEFTLPLVYYKGYSAVLKAENGNEISLAVRQNSDIRVTVINDSGLTGTIYVSYGGTVIQKISVIISGLSLVSLIGLFIFLRKRTVSTKN